MIPLGPFLTSDQRNRYVQRACPPPAEPFQYTDMLVLTSFLLQLDLFSPAVKPPAHSVLCQSLLQLAFIRLQLNHQSVSVKFGRRLLLIERWKLSHISFNTILPVKHEANVLHVCLVKQLQWQLIQLDFVQMSSWLHIILLMMNHN